MSTATETVRALIRIEDQAPDALYARVPGSDAHLWPLMRWPLAAALAQNENNVVPASRHLSKMAYARKQLLSVLPNPRSSDSLRLPAESLFIVSGTTRDSTDDGYRNWLVDAYATALGERAVVVQDAPLGAWPRGEARPLNARTWSFAEALLRVDRATRLRPLTSEHRAQVSATVSEILALAAPQLDSPLAERVLSQTLRRADRAPHADREFGRLLDRVRPRRIYMQTAAYGDRSSFVRMAHARGIEVHELQHGWIGPAHAAYNFGAAMHQTPLRDSLPDCLLTFGRYWGARISFPGQVIPVGKPSLGEAVSQSAPFTDREHRVLVISSMYEREKLTSTCVALRALLPSFWRIVLRPHPSERPVAELVYADALASGIELDDEPDVTRSLARARGVIGIASTVLFEALPFDCRIGVVETALGEHYADSSIFPSRIDSEASLARYVGELTEAQQPHLVASDAVWHPDPVRTFLAIDMPETA